jgi:hypothetical protein
VRQGLVWVWDGSLKFGRDNNHERGWMESGAWPDPMDSQYRVAWLGFLVRDFFSLFCLDLSLIFSLASSLLNLCNASL